MKKRTEETSLKMFKHYKLKPSFSIIKGEKAKDKVGVALLYESPKDSLGKCFVLLSIGTHQMKL